MAKIKVIDYLTKIEHLKFPKENGLPLLDVMDTSEYECVHDLVTNFVERWKYDGYSFYTKQFDNNRAIRMGMEILTSAIYNEIGINAVECYPIIIQEKNETRRSVLASQDLNSLQPLEVKKPDDIGVLKDFLTSLKTMNIFTLLKNKKKLTKLTEDKQPLFTENCINETIKMLIADNLFMQEDRHLNNFFVAKKKNEKEFDSVFAFDHEESFLNRFFMGGKDSLKSLLTSGREGYYMSRVPVKDYYCTYIDLLEDVIRCYDKYDFDQGSDNLLKNITDLNLDTLINQIEKQTKFKFPTRQKDIYKSLVDHLQTKFDKCM